jgi:serine/threonine protein kinase
VDGRADIYAVGIMAYQILTGINYFMPPGEKSFKERGRYVLKLMDEPIPPPIEVRPDIPKELSDIVAVMLKRDPEERFPTAGVAGRMLEQKYLYSSGFGPTNNSLASYIDIFESGFRDYDQEQLYQLVFLKDKDGKIDLKRKISKTLYTPLGQKLSAERNT